MDRWQRRRSQPAAACAATTRIRNYRPSLCVCVGFHRPLAPIPTLSLLSAGGARASLSAPSERAVAVTVRLKLLFASGEFGLSVVTIVQGFFLNSFLLEVAAVPPYAAAAILLAAQIFDAVADPVLGRMSDRTRSPLGRRRPWIVYGAVPGGVCYAALWQVPGEPGDFWLSYYYGVMAILVTFTHTMVAVPYAAITTELSDDYDERTSLTMWRVGAGVVGGVVAIGAHSVLIESFLSAKTGAVDYVAGYAVSGAVLGVVVALAPLVTGAAVREKYASTESAVTTKSYWQALKATASRAFLVAALLYTLSWISIATVQSQLFLWCKYVLVREEHFMYIIIVIQVVAALSLWLWSALSARLGKRGAFAISCVMLTAILTGAFFVDATTGLAWIYVTSALAGVGLGGAMLLPWSMLPDIVDADELKTGSRREGDFYGLFVMLQKIGLGVSLAAGSMALGSAGYVSPETGGGDHQHVEQPDDVRLVLRVLIGPLPAALMAIALLFTACYPLSRARHREIRRQRFVRHVGAAVDREESLG
jgi:GPH family glycoside/pentoside/hexuronide:cation symporter